MATEPDHKPSFEEAGKSRVNDENILSEFIGFLRDNKKWWLLPILIAFLVIGVVLALAASGAAPFVYTLF